MTRRSLGIMLASLALVAAGCDPDGATTETEPSDTETTTSGEVTGDCADVRTTVEGELEFPALLFVPGLVAVDEGTGGDAVAALGEDRVSATDAAAAYQAVSFLEGATFESYEGDLVGEIDGLVDFLETSQDENPLEIALELEGLGIDAAPISAIGFVGHWGFRPGSDPAPISIQGDLEVALGVNGDVAVEGYVGVVDSGIDDSDLPSWMRPEAVVYDPEDTETGGVASHGTFVTDLVRRIAPEYGVSLAKAHAVPGTSYDVYPESHDKPQIQVSNELDVAYAVMRLMDRNIEYSALNLSLGAYIPDPGQPDLQLILLQNVLAKWEGGPILAAAGNENLTLPHFPAALSNPDVVSVAAGDPSQAAVPTLPSGVSSQWFDHIVPGVDLVGLAGGVDQDGDPRLVCWSGSSFATAVATAMTVQGNSLTPDPHYGSVPGLSFIDSTGNLVVNP
jgi:hypothetical protein